MSQTAALLMLPSREPTDAEKDALEGATRVLTQSLEDRRRAEGVEHALRATGYGALRGVEVSVQARLVILEGRVPSYYLKQVAQASALSVPGVDHVRNDLDVAQPN